MKFTAISSHTSPVTLIKLNHDGDLLFSASNDKNVAMYYSISGEKIGTFRCMAAVKGIDISEDSKYLISCTAIGHYELWNIEGGSKVGICSTGRRGKYIQFLAGSEKFIVLSDEIGVSNSSQLAIYDMKVFLKPSECTKADAIFELNDNFQCGILGPLNTKIYLGSTKGLIRCVDLASGKTLKQYQMHSDAIRNMQFDKKFCFLSSSATDGVKVFNPTTFKVMRHFKFDVPMACSAFTPNIHAEGKQQQYHMLMGGGVIARNTARTSEGGYEINMMNLQFDEPIGKISGHFGPINWIEYHKDGKGFITAGEEGIVRIYRFLNSNPDSVKKVKKQK